jgi:UDP-4-amino-4,6-dideoxy-N-acetyl-beta-L-altrosamine N-acetyltransferase
MVDLTSITPEDKLQLLEWRNDPSVSKYMYKTHQISRDEHEQWFHDLLSRDDRQGWIIRMDGSRVGAAFVHNIDQDNSRATWAFYLAEPSTRGRGVGSGAEFLVLDEVFVNMKLHKLCGEVLSFNQAVLALHRKFGFVEEGVLREHWRRDGEWVDVHIIAMFRDSWLSRRDEQADALRRRGIIP